MPDETRAAMPYRLRIPGPTAVPERVRLASALPMINHRGPEFHDCFAEIDALIRPLFGTTGDVLFFAASGTGVMEAALANALRPGDAVLVVENGQFGERFSAIAGALGCVIDALPVTWGAAPDPAAIAERLARRAYRAVCVVYNESATGAVADLAAIGTVVRDHPALLIVDAVSALGGLPLRQDDWHLDIVFTASQKALMCPPGLGLVAVSAKAWPVIEQDTGMPRFAWDFRKAKAARAKAETPFTPPVSLLFGLREALRMIHAEGVEAVLARHRRLAAGLRAGAAALGLPLFPERAAASDTVTVLHVPEGLEGGAIVRHMYEHYGTVIAGSRTRLAGRVIRFGTMGWLSETDILTDLALLERSLTDLGFSPSPGAGRRAAAVFDG